MKEASERRRRRRSARDEIQASAGARSTLASVLPSWRSSTHRLAPRTGRRARGGKAGGPVATAGRTSATVGRRRPFLRPIRATTPQPSARGGPLFGLWASLAVEAHVPTCRHLRSPLLQDCRARCCRATKRLRGAGSRTIVRLKRTATPGVRGFSQRSPEHRRRIGGVALAGAERVREATLGPLECARGVDG
jgi:hypothetical protein